MLFEDFFNQENHENEDITEYFYTATLSAWLIYNDLDVFDSVLRHFEEKEEYAICAGIHKAIEKIDEIYNNRFDEATVLYEDDEKVEYTFDEHKKISKLIFEDVLKEIYEKQVSKHKEDN